MSRFHNHQHRHEHQPGPFALHSCRGKYGEDVTVGGKHYCGGIRRFSKYRRQNANNNWSQERKGSLISFDNPFRRRSSRETGIHPSASYSRYLRDSPPSDIFEDPLPPPPPLEFMAKIPGYETATYEPVVIYPPVPGEGKDAFEGDDEPRRGQLPRLPELTKQEARAALLKYVANRYCYGKSAAKQMTIDKIDNSCAFQYTLESFCEKRQVCWAYEPYSEGSVDGPDAGAPPSAWSIPVDPGDNFIDKTCSIHVPHTEITKSCHACGGSGRNKCATCMGNGWETCYSCNGDGIKAHPLFVGETEKCYHCNVTGRRKCRRCEGDVFIICKACQGKGRIKCFIKLTVTWTNHTDDHIVDTNSSVPTDLLRLVSGSVVFEEVHGKIFPVDHFPDVTINMASAQLALKHIQDHFNDSKALLQRQIIKVIPVASVHYEWKSKSGIYSVYGFEHQVHAPSYPQKNCFSCSIL